MAMKPSRLIAAGVVLVAGGYAAWHFTRPAHNDAPATQPVPVSAVPATDATIPVYLRGIGTVTALNAVEIRPQVGGTLLEVPIKEGQLVKKGDVLAVIDPRPYKAALDKAQAQLTQDQAQLENAQLDLQRYSTLAKSDFASRQQVDTQRSTSARLQGVVDADKAAIEEAQINLSYCVIQAPMAGRVGLRRVDPGNLVQANSTGTGIISLVQDQPITVVFALPETDLPQIRSAMKNGQPKVLADSSDESAQLATGVLLTPDNSVDPTSGTIQLKAQFANEELSLTPGEFVSVRLEVSTAHGVTVPHTAIQHGLAGLFVFTIKPDTTIERKPVDVAYDDGTSTVLARGVDAGAQVVTAGQTRIGPGVKVATRDPSQNTPQSAQK